MRFRASPLMVAVALGLVNASVLTAEVPGRSSARSVRAEPVAQPGETATAQKSSEKPAAEKPAAEKPRSKRI